MSVARRIGGRALKAALAAGVVALIVYRIISDRPTPHVLNAEDRTVLQRLEDYDQTHGTNLVGLCGEELNSVKWLDKEGDPEVTLCTDLLSEGYVSDAEYVRLLMECNDAHGGDDKVCGNLPVKAGGTRGSAKAIDVVPIDNAVREYCRNHPDSVQCRRVVNAPRPRGGPTNPH